MMITNIGLRGSQVLPCLGTLIRTVYDTELLATVASYIEAWSTNCYLSEPSGAGMS